MNMNSRTIILLTALAGMLPAIAARAAENGAGIVKTSQGTVTLDRGGQKSPAPVGTVVFVGDRMFTGPESYVGITLRDDTLMSAGPDSVLLVNEFKFNSTTNDGNMLISLLKGTFSVVTGLIGKQSPKSVDFRTPTMTLGIRGTEFVVWVAGAAD